MSIRVGVIGGGIWGNYHLSAIRNLEDQGKAKLAAVATRTEASAKRHEEAYKVKGYTDYKMMIEEEDLDAVTIATPDHLHLEMTLYALGKGKHVLVEKPMDLKTAGCVSMVNLAREKNLLLQVDFHKRYDPYNIDAMRKVREGKVGEPYYAYAYMEDKIVVPTKWLAGWSAQSSPFWFIGVHKFDLVRWMTGREALSVLARGRKGKLSSLGFDTFDTVSAMILMEGGMTCTIDVNWILPLQFEAVVNQGLRLVGSEGILELDSQDRGLRYCFSSDGMVTPNPGAFFMEETLLGKQVQGYFIDAIKDFVLNVSFLKSGGSLKQIEGRYPSGQDGLRATQVAEAVEKSIKEERTVKVSELEGGR